MYRIFLRLTRNTKLINYRKLLLSTTPSTVRVIVKPIIIPISKVILLSTPFIFLSTKQSLTTAEDYKMDDIIKQMEAMYEKNQLKEAYEFLLPHKDVEDANVQWKFARLCYRMGKMENSSNPKNFAEIAMKHIDKAVAMDPNSFHAQKWRGIILSWYCDFEGYKKKIERSYEIRQNFDAACKLDPNDPTARHLLGRWCFSVADVPWYMKSAAKYILAELPSATYEDALAIFLEAEKIEEGFFSQNWLYIGKTYYSLKKKEEAKVWLQKAAGIAGDNQDDKEAKTEATELLRKI